MTWHQTQPVSSIISTLFKLDGIARSLEELVPDASDIIGTLTEETRPVGLAHAYAPHFEAPGCSAMEALLLRLDEIRNAWIEETTGLDWSTANQSQCDLLMEAERDVPSVDDAVREWVRENRRMAA